MSESLLRHAETALICPEGPGKSLRGKETEIQNSAGKAVTGAVAAGATREGKRRTGKGRAGPMPSPGGSG